jgi:predicted Zn-dependent peptidase
MRTLIQCLLLVCLFHAANAQNTTWLRAKSGEYQYSYVKNDPMKVRFYILKNGLTVILTENKEIPRLQTIIATKAGSKTDPKNHTGLAHYLEHMLFKGTNKYGSLDWQKENPLLDKIDALYAKYNLTTDEEKRKLIYREIDATSGEAAKFSIANEYDKLMSIIGAQGTNAFTSFEQTAYINDIPSNQIDKWITIEAERFRNPILRLFHTELEAVYEEKNISLDSDDEKVSELLFAKLFQKHNYGQQTTIGTIEHLKNPSLTAIREYFYENYVPNNMCIVLAGDFNSDEVIGKIDKAFAYMKPKPVPTYQFEKENEITKPIEASVYGPDAEYVSIGFRFPGANTNDARLLNFMSNILSNGNAGLMDLNLVKKQEVLEASAGAYTLQDYSVLFMDGIAKEGQSLETVKKLLLNQIKLLQSGHFDNNILQAIINNYKKSMIKNRERNSGRAFALLESFTSNVSWEKSVNELEYMSKLTKADIQSFAKKWLNNNYVCIYKRIGEEQNTKKVVKPTITPVSVNRDAESDFVKNIAKQKVSEVKPKFLNFDKDIQRAKSSNNGNSIDVFAVKNNTNELFTQIFFLKMGSFHDKLLPIAMDYLQYLGTSKYTAEEISQKFYRLASDFSVNENEDESYITINGLQSNYEASIELFEHLVRNCVANEKALKNMIAGMKKKRADDKLNKDIIQNGLAVYAKYGAVNPFNYGFNNSELDKIQASDLIQILHQLTSFPHQVLYYGPFDASTVSEKLSKLHPLPKNFNAFPKVAEFTFRKLETPEVLFANYDMVTSEIMWYRNGGNYDANKMPTTRMFNEYFGGNMSGIVFQEIRESKALAYSSFANFGTPKYSSQPNHMTAYVGCQADKMSDAIEGMQSLLTELPKSEKLFANSKLSLQNSISTSRSTKTGILIKYLNALNKGINYDMDEKVYNEITDLKYEDINLFYNSNISSKPYSLCVVANESKLNWDVLKKYGDVKKLSLEEIFGY